MVHQTFGHVEFHCKMRVGKITIICRTMPLKKQVVLIPMFDTRIGKFVDLGYGEKDLRDDLDDIIRIIGSKDMGQDAFFYAFDKFIIKHIDKYGRLIDTDLFRMVAEIILIMAALKGEILNDKMYVELRGMELDEYIEDNFQFSEISLNGDRVLWSNGLFEGGYSPRITVPAFLSLFFQMGDLRKMQFSNQSLLIEFYGTTLGYDIYERLMKTLGL